LLVRIEELSVGRVPLDRVVNGPVPVRHEGDTMSSPLVVEVMVVEERLVLKEELRIIQRRVVEHTPRCSTLRREDATVERLTQTEQIANRSGKGCRDGENDCRIICKNLDFMKQTVKEQVEMHSG
jgi:stress response protein YsnF